MSEVKRYKFLQIMQETILLYINFISNKAEIYWLSFNILTIFTQQYNSSILHKTLRSTTTVKVLLCNLCKLGYTVQNLTSQSTEKGIHTLWPC